MTETSTASLEQRPLRPRPERAEKEGEVALSRRQAATVEDEVIVYPIAAAPVSFPRIFPQL